MKLQNLSIIFAIIIIPVTLILSAYIGSQIDTASLQQSYDTTLMDATHDAVVAFELNTSNNAYSNNADSIRRDIQASINTFTTSLANGLNVPGANSEYIMPYIPAILITLYDGYYIYSPSEYSYSTKVEEDEQWVEKQQTGYQHVLKPYVYYSAKYVKDDGNWVVVNYSLDNYITIYGMINNSVVSKSGYLGTKNLNYIENNTTENLSEFIKYKSGNDIVTLTDPVEFVYNNGRKVYRIGNKWYYLNDLNLQEAKDFNSIVQDTSAQNYKNSANDFNTWINNSGILSIVTPANAVKIGSGASNEKYSEFAGNSIQILSTDPEDPASEFNQHKREIIRLSIQDNLNNAMAIYNANSGAMGTNATFSMPKLSELDWDKILNNVNFVTFMQGLPVGNKIYNSYSIVSSSNNKQYIRPDSIYFIYNNEYHTINHIIEMKKNNSSFNLSSIIGYKSSDFTKVKYETKDNNGNDVYRYYYRRPEYACYECIVDSSKNTELNISNESDDVKKLYYTALARERYNLDKVTKRLINYDN